MELFAGERSFYYGLISALFFTAVITFISLFFVSAPYGRYSRKGWGPEISARLGWIIQEAPSVIGFAVFFFIGEYRLNPVPLILFSMWQIHYVNRTFIYPFRMKGNKKNATLATVALAFLFTLLNGYINGRYLSHFSGGYDTGWLTDFRFILGALIFFTGLSVNLHSDSILRNLRKPDESGYKIPRGGMFEYVSCPNYLGEIIEWAGFALAAWSPAGLCFAVWTAANLAPRALSHHKWYMKNFDDYPKDRKALIPGII
jgi:protein-S-isoprenylcysteine O-methyltransferase Ste14